MDKIHLEFKRRYRGNVRPPLEFFIKAYTKMVQHFAEEVNTNDHPLSAVVKDVSSWMHFWGSWDPLQFCDWGIAGCLFWSPGD